MAISLRRTFLKKLWPDFNQTDLKKIIVKYKKVLETLVKFNGSKFK